MSELSEATRALSGRDVSTAPRASSSATVVDDGRAPSIDRGTELRARGAQATTGTEVNSIGHSDRTQLHLSVPPTVHEHFAQISSSPTFQRLSVAQQQKFVEALDAVLRFEDGRRDREKLVRDFTTLLDRKIDGEPALFQKDRTGTGQTLLDNLHTLATHERDLLEPILRDQRDHLLRSMVAEMVRPDHEVNQGTTVTCVPTTANRVIAAEQPAEYARIIMELATTGRSSLYHDNAQTGVSERSTTLGLCMPSGSSSPEWLQGRSISEAMFQDSAMEMVGGYSDGLYSNQIEVLYEGLWGRPFVRLDAGQDMIEALRETCNAGLPSMVSMRWASQGLHANHALEVRAVVGAADIQRINGRDVVVIGKEPNQTVVPVDRALRQALSEGEVIIARNPWGSEYPNPTEVGAHTIDRDTALFWMKSGTFESRANFVMVADSVRGAAFGVTEGGSWGEGVRTQFVLDAQFRPVGLDLSRDVEKILARRENNSDRLPSRRKGAVGSADRELVKPGLETVNGREGEERSKSGI